LAGRSSRPILVTGSHRAGTTWVGKMIHASPYTYYLGELFHPGDGRLEGLVNHWFQYVTADSSEKFAEAVGKVLALDFRWPGHTRRWQHGRLALLAFSRRWFGWPRPLLKDPIAVFSADWLARSFPMDVLCLVRHPAAFVGSLKRANWRFDFQNLLVQPRLMEEWLLPYADRLSKPPDNLIEEGALLWLCIYHVLSCQRAQHPEWWWWRVEDISAGPAQAFATIYQQIGLPYSAAVRRQVVAYSDAANPAGGQLHDIRRNSQAAQEQWRQILTAQEINSIRAIVEPVSHRYYSEAEWEK
jgi:hypothetical protein